MSGVGIISDFAYFVIAIFYVEFVQKTVNDAITVSYLYKMPYFICDTSK